MILRYDQAILRSQPWLPGRTGLILRFELPTTASAAPSATLLDRVGNPINVPVQVTTRDEGGVHWIVVDATIAPLAPSDYAVEVKAGEATRTIAFRVVP